MRTKSLIDKFWINKRNRHILIIVSIYLLLILILRNRWDYKEYERQWMFFLDGGNPWDYGSNAYGPFHNVMAFFYQIYNKLPRFIFSVCSIASSIYLINRINNSSLDKSLKTKYFYLLLYNPIIVIMFVINGCNDGLIGCLFLFGVILYDKEKFVLSALLLSIAILYKYIPIFILPFLFINKRRINWKFSLSTMMFLISGFGLSFYLWGEKLLSPLLFNSSRESKILSIFRYFRGDYSFLRIFGIENIDYLSTYLVISSVVVVFILHLIYNWNWLRSLVLTMLFVHLFYLVGHFQFYISIYFISFIYILKLSEQNKVFLINKVTIFIYWIAGTMILFGITEGFYRYFSIIRDFIGLPHFAILALTIFSIIKHEHIKYKQRISTE